MSFEKGEGKVIELNKKHAKFQVIWSIVGQFTAPFLVEFDHFAFPFSKNNDFIVYGLNYTPMN